MKAYLLSILAASIAAALINLLSPAGEGGGIGKHLKLTVALFLICVLITPLKSGMEAILDWSSGKLPFWENEEDIAEDYRDRLDGALTDASREYVAQALTETLQAQFDMDPGTVRCALEWSGSGEEARPSRVTVLLSGKSIWKDPHAIEDFVTELLDCECITAIE